MAEERETWGSTVSFILACIGYIVMMMMMMMMIDNDNDDDVDAVSKNGHICAAFQVLVLYIH